MNEFYFSVPHEHRISTTYDTQTTEAQKNDVKWKLKEGYSRQTEKKNYANLINLTL